MQRRWDTDARGRGVGDGRRLEPGARELLDALTEPEWVAEDPEAHLMRHIERGCSRPESLFSLVDARTEEDGALVVDLSWLGRPHDLRSVRAAAFTLIGEVAESATYVRQRQGDDSLTFEAATGMLAPDTDFAPHGHVLILRITDPFG